jgi:tetratricopeptide (TPR) repeat protein
MTYLLGRHAEAAEAFRALLAARDRGASVPDDVWTEALIYLGEIAYLAGDRSEAEAAFRQVLEFNLDQRISPYDHPMDVIGVFELVREGVTTERRAVPPERHPYPWWGYAPLGVPQFKQAQPVRGAFALVFQAGLAGASVGAWVAIDRLQIPTDSELPLDEAQRRADRAALLRSALSIPTASAFYLAWGASALDGGLTWRRAHPTSFVGASRAGVQLAVGPRLDLPGLVVVGAF